MQAILDYLTETYHPLSILVYGSYADGTNCGTSDFDALVITEASPVYHDTALVGGTRLDVFVYPKKFFASEPDWADFVQLADSRIITDTDGLGAGLQTSLKQYLTAIPPKSSDAVREELAWCNKMLQRAKQADTEGLYRWHWLLTDSLEIFCDLKGIRYPGPKKALRWMEQNASEAYRCYAAALQKLSYAALETWVAYLLSLAP